MRGHLLSILFSIVSLMAYAQQGPLYVYCGKYFDVERARMAGPATVVVQGDTVLSVESGLVPVPEAAELIDLREYYLLPGLIDLHVHIESETGALRYLEPYVMEEADIAYRAQHYAGVTLRAGFTTVRDLGGTGVNASLREAINQGLVEGPRIFTARKSIAVTGGHADPTNGAKEGLFKVPGPEHGVANGPAACRQAVRYQYQQGADLIKITATGGVLSVAKDGFRPAFTDEELEAIVGTATDLGMSVAAHAHGDEGMRRAVRAGVKTIEHGTLMSEETMRLMIEKNAYLVPTITAGKAVADSAQIPGYYPELVRPKALFIGPKIQETFARAYRLGVPIAFGTDAGVFKHGRNALEFAFMVEAGMPPVEALLSATKTNAALLGMDGKIGSIRPGAFADLIAVKTNPLEDITALQTVSWVMKGGVIYKN